MRYAMLIATLISTTVYATPQEELVKAAIHHLQPSIDDVTLTQVSLSVIKYSQEYDLDWMIMASIIGQESSFRKDPQGCMRIHRLCDDLGIAQINYKVWGRVLRLHRIRLLTDIDYNIETMARILSILKDSYGDEKHWHTRYHSFTRSHRKIYADFIYHKYLKINSYLKGFADGTIEANRAPASSEEE